MQELGYADIEKMAALAVGNTKDARAMQVSTESLAGYLTATDNQALMIMLAALGAA
jgi:hypothetical protein